MQDNTLQISQYSEPLLQPMSICLFQAKVTRYRFHPTKQGCNTLDRDTMSPAYEPPRFDESKLASKKQKKKKTNSFSLSKQSCWYQANEREGTVDVSNKSKGVTNVSKWKDQPTCQGKLKKSLEIFKNAKINKLGKANRPPS